MKNSEQEATRKNATESPQPVKRGFFRIFWKICKYTVLLVFLLAGALAGGFYWLLDTDSGQEWLVKTANNTLGPQPDKDGLTIKITRLSGSLPFDFKLGLELGDKNGTWLTAPENEFNLNWRELPKTVRIKNLRLANADLTRFPDLPPSPPAEPGEPFTLGDFKNLLIKANNFLCEKPWWLPQIYIDKISAENFRLPAEILPQKKPDERISVNLNLTASVADGKITASLSADAANEDKSPVDLKSVALNQLTASLDLNGEALEAGLKTEGALKVGVAKPVLGIKDIPEDFFGNESVLNLKLLAFAASDGQKINLDLSGPDLDAGAISLKTDGSWQSGKAWLDNELDGSARLDILAKVTPAGQIAETSPLAMLRAPVELNVNAQGDLPKLTLGVNLDGSNFQIDKYSLTNLQVALRSEELDIPLTKEGLAALENENNIKTAISGIFDKENIDLNGDIFIQALTAGVSEKTNAGDQGWRVGIRGLKLNALDLDLSGDMAALLLPDKKPALDGQIAAKVNGWRGINQFLNGQTGSGNVELNLKLLSGLDNDPSQKLEATHMEASENLSDQKAVLSVKASNLALRPPKGKGYGVGKLELEANAENVFVTPAFNVNLIADRIQAENLTVNAKSSVSGKLAGPINAQLQATGDVMAAVDASWEPGKALLKKLDFSMNSGKLLPDAKKGVTVGIAMAKPATLLYGETGLRVDGLDVKITPSGRLRAQGGLSREKLDFSLNLDSLEFKPWQALVSEIPSGKAEIRLNLSGTPQKPGGAFRAALKEIKLPKVPLAPLGVNITGALKPGSGRNSLFGVQIEIDKSTLKALGANTASISAGIPVLFKDDGTPEINMTDNMAARVRWDGALGPIWNLVPVADQRVNGRLVINLDASGTLKKPKIRGGINIDQGRYANLQYGVLLTDIFLKLNLSDRGSLQKVGDMEMPGGITLEAGVSDGHKGTVRINGRADIDGKNLDMKVRLDRLKPLRRRDIHVEISGDLTAVGEMTAPDVKGSILINRGEILLDNLAMTGSVTTLDITQTPVKKASVETTPAPVGNLDISIRMLPRFRVDGRGLGSVWQANLLVQGPLNNPSITGTINAVNGNFDFLGKIFELTKGTVTFAGGSLSNPLLDIELTNETPDLTAHIIVTGTVSKMRLILTSEPQVPRDEILSRVLFGKSINDLSRLEALQLAAAVAQLAGFGGGGGITSFTKKALGIDVLRIGTSSSGAAGEEESGAGGTTVEAGKYITDQLYMGVQQGMKPDSTAFIIQFELTPRTSLEVISESNSTWGGLNWKYTY